MGPIEARPCRLGVAALQGMEKKGRMVVHRRESVPAKKKKNCFTKPPYLAPYNWKPGKKWGFKGDETVHVPFFSAHETPSYARNTPNYWESLEGKEGKKS